MAKKLKNDIEVQSSVPQFTEEQLKEIKLLQASNEMMERTKAEARERGADSSTLKMIDVAQSDIFTQLRNINTNIADETIQSNMKKTEETKLNFTNYEDKSVFDMLNQNLGISDVKNETVIEKTSVNDIDTTAQYDVISLPSNGEGYKNKISRIPVAYLTAYDENFITSPNLYRDGLIIDFLLKNKVMNKNINVDELYKGDVDAIMLFLRITSYGPEFPVTVRDPKTGKQIDYTIDLSKLKTKEFKLKGDENGLFKYELPLSKDVVKFKFLTRKEELILDKITNIENNGTVATLLNRNVNDIKTALNDDTLLTESEKRDISNYLTKINNWAKKIEEQNVAPFNKSITNRFELQIMSINDNSDKSFIRNYIKNMRAMDSLMLRKYINDNEPGINFEVEIERPEELGGGSFTTFLEWSDTVFINIPEL